MRNSSDVTPITAHNDQFVPGNCIVVVIPLHRPPLHLRIHRFHALHIHQGRNTWLQNSRIESGLLTTNSLNVSSMSFGDASGER